MVNRLLLTGAGFTHNFGAPLVGGIWAQIFNNPILQKHYKIQKLLSETFNYERVYETVMTDDEEFDEYEKEALHEAVAQAFQFVDYVVRIPSNIHHDMQHGVIKIIEHFTKDQGGSGYFFTLNQDLYVERKCRIPRIKYTFPGLEAKITDKDMSKLVEEDYTRLPTAPELEGLKATFTELDNHEIAYVKLHGSHHWHDSEGKGRTIITDNLDRSKEPLLMWYRDIFEKCLSVKNSKLLVIGYSFRDDYINTTLAKHIVEDGLQLHVLSPLAPQIFKGKLAMRTMGDEIYSGLAGYYECNFEEMFPAEMSLHLSRYWHNLNSNYFKS